MGRKDNAEDRQSLFKIDVSIYIVHPRQRNGAYDRRMMDANYVSERLTSLKHEMRDLQDFNGRHSIRNKHTALDNSARASRQERLLQIKRELSDMLKRCA